MMHQKYSSNIKWVVPVLAGTEPFPIFNKLLTWKEAKDENFEKPYAIGEVRDAPTSWYLKSRRKRYSSAIWKYSLVITDFHSLRVHESNIQSFLLGFEKCVFFW